MALKMNPLEPKQEQLIFALLHERTKADAAAAAGVPKRTMYWWFRDARFKAAYQAALRDAFDESIAVLFKSAAKAALALVDELDSSTATGKFSVIAAASRILDLAFKAHTAVAVEEELEELRMVIAALKLAGPPPRPS